MWLLIKQALIAGSACCSSGAFFPSLVGSDDWAQLGTSFQGSTVIGSSSSDGESTFLNDQESDRSMSQQIYGGLRLFGEWQAGASFGWYGRERNVYEASESSMGLADTLMHLTYDPLPEWAISASLLIPTAPNPYESRESLRTDSFGRGLWTPSISGVYRESWAPWDLHASSSLRFAVGRDFERPVLGEVSVESIWGLSAVMGAGYQWNLWRLRSGLSMGVHWDEGVQERDRFQVRSAGYRMVWDVTADVSIPLPLETRLLMSYKDQTLMGPTQNSELARSISLSFSKSWSL